MKTLGIILLGLAIACGLSGLWCAMASFAWASYWAWTCNDEDEEMED